MKKIRISSCSNCPHRDHSGAFTPGGAKPTCVHDDTLKRVKREHGDHHWKYRVIEDFPKIPSWCPLGDDK